MHKTIVSDTSCFIILSNIDELALLQKVYREIITTQDIAAEFGEVLPEWVLIETVKDKPGNSFWNCRSIKASRVQ